MLFHRGWLIVSDWGWARSAWFTYAVPETILMFMCEFECSPSLCRSESLKINFQRLEMYFPGPCFSGLAHYRMHPSLWLRCLWALYCQINTNKWDWFMSYQPSVILHYRCGLAVVRVAPVQLLEAVCTLCTLLVALFSLWEGEDTIPEAWSWLLNFCSLSSLLLSVMFDRSHKVTY